MSVSEKLNNFLNTLAQVLSVIKNICMQVINIAIPVGGALIASDVILGTKFGVLIRLVSLLTKIGLTGNILTILVVVGLFAWYNNKK